MASKKLIILSLFAFVSPLLAKTAEDYVHAGAQKYIFGQEDAAEAEIDSGLEKFPNDPDLQQMAGLVRKKKPPPQQQEEQQKQQQQQQNQQQQQQQQNQQQSRDQQQQQQQQQQQGQQEQKDQRQSQDKTQLQAKNEPQKKQQPQSGQSPSPSPGAQQQQPDQPSPSPGERKAEQSPSPGEGENEMPSPTPGEGEEDDASPTPSESPQKKLAGEVKGGAGEDKSQKPADKNAAIAEAESEKKGEMSERQALALLESMKDEEARVQLDERKVRRRVYNDW